MVSVDPRIERCGFARIVGENIDFLMRKYSITMGRKSKNNASDLVLGDHMSLSRQHARIFFDFDKNDFFLEVLGKNGATVNGKPCELGDPPTVLTSPSLLQMGDISLYFLLPKKIIRRGAVDIEHPNVQSPVMDAAALTRLLQENPALMQTVIQAAAQQQQTQNVE